MRHRFFQIVLAAMLMLVVSALGCVDPKDRRPGLRLSGEVVNEPISDWSFADEFQLIYLETRTWYQIPHSVTTVCAGIGEKLYVPSIYYGGGEWPDKYWNSNVSSDPRVRLEIDGKIYEREAVVVEDATEFQAATLALAAKYPLWQEMLAKPESERPDMALIRMDPRSN